MRKTSLSPGPCSWTSYGSSSGEESYLLTCQEGSVLSGSSYAAPPEPLQVSSRFSASLRCPPTSPSGGSNCGSALIWTMTLGIACSLSLGNSMEDLDDRQFMQGLCSISHAGPLLYPFPVISISLSCYICI